MSKAGHVLDIIGSDTQALSEPFLNQLRLCFDSFYYCYILIDYKICAMDTLELCGDILQPGGQLETPGLVMIHF